MSNKNSLEIAYQNARDLIHKKEYLPAVSQLNEILRIFPNELNSIYLLIDCFIKINKPLEALEYTHKALSFKSDDKKLLLLEIRLNEFLERDSEAIVLLKTFISKYSDFSALKQGLILNRLAFKTCDEIINGGCKLLSTYTSLTPLRKLWIAWRSHITL